MINLPAKPQGSAINVERDFNRLTISWKNPRGGVRRYAMLAFLTVWMCGWVFGEAAALRQVLGGGQGSGFLIFWLAGWTFGGIFCAATIFRLIQPARPERISLDSIRLEHDPGPGPLPWSGFGRAQRNSLEVFKPGRKQTVAKKDIGEIRLDRVGERQRLSFDCGAKRIEVGEFLEEPEREWLFAVLKSWKSV